jgi:hypothetical protein
MKTLSQIFGKKVSIYDEWNGSNTIVTVSSIEITEDGKEIAFVGISYWGNLKKVYIPVELVDSFMETGKATTYYEIDHCTIGKTWEILN